MVRVEPLYNLMNWVPSKENNKSSNRYIEDASIALKLTPKCRQSHFVGNDNGVEWVTNGVEWVTKGDDFSSIDIWDRLLAQLCTTFN
jgi:hypothetical protein